jgi:hypothetical protein
LDKTRRYVGVYHDNSGGITTAGNIIGNAWFFGLLPENDTICCYATPGGLRKNR